MNISITRSQTSKPRPDDSALGFGRYFTDHMFLMDYEKEWQNARIVPYGPLELDPATMTLHYGQEVFEGLKAYRGADGKIRLFRAIENIRRFNRSNERMYAPLIDEELFMRAMTELVRVDAGWTPHSPDASLYIRPFLIAADPFLGVRASNTYLFVIILSPVGAYYSGGMSPTSILVENEDVRAVRGGLGFAKTGANYAATIRAQERAKTKGFTQVLWLDALERRYIEEIGTSNAFFIIDGVAVTPSLNGSILPGITRMSVIELLKSWSIECQERPVSIDEVISAAGEGRLDEAFASGTAAVISPIGSMTYRDREIKVNNGDIGKISQRLYDTLTGIQWGRRDDPFGWTTVVE